jgi:hypothetical protein
VSTRGERVFECRPLELCQVPFFDCGQHGSS